MLLESWNSERYSPYTVKLNLRDGKVHGSVSFEMPTPKVKYTKENAVIAIVELSKTAELLSYQTISLHNLLGLSKIAKNTKNGC
jgi:hypothetical protein